MVRDLTFRIKILLDTFNCRLRSSSEACKKFFLRSVNEEYLKYKCIREKNCLITRTTRTQCQFCRYAKCIEVGMKLSGWFSIPLGWNLTRKNLEESPNPKIEDIFRQIPCAVCQNSSSGIHFGATTCEVISSTYRETARASRCVLLGLQGLLSAHDARTYPTTIQMSGTEQLRDQSSHAKYVSSLPFSQVSISRNVHRRFTYWTAIELVQT